MAEQTNVVITACRQAWGESWIKGISNQSNCSGFVKSVAKILHVTMADGKADPIVDFISKGWLRLENGTKAQSEAAAGSLVIAGLRGDAHTSKRDEGHVVVIAPGPLYHGKYPKCWGGRTGTAQSSGNKSVGEVWNRSDRDNVEYFKSPTTPKP